MSDKWEGCETISANELGKEIGLTGKTIKKRIQDGKINGEKVLNKYGVQEYRISVAEAKKIIELELDKKATKQVKKQSVHNSVVATERQAQTQFNAFMEWSKAKEELAKTQGILQANKEERDFLRERLEYLEKALTNQNDNWITGWREVAATIKRENEQKSWWQRLFGK